MLAPATVTPAQQAAATAVAPPGEVGEAAQENPAVVSEPWSLRPGAFLQPQYRLNEYSPTTGYTNGFRFARARLTATAEGRVGTLLLSAYFEAETQPQFSLEDAYMTAKYRLSKRGYLTLDVGQTRVPISREQMLSDTRTSFIDKPQLAYPTPGNGIAPDRDLGARLWIKPAQAPWLRVIGGVFNGEGRNQVQNINEAYFYAGRVEVTPLGDEMPFAESTFDGNWLTFALSTGHNRLSPATNYDQLVDYYGADVSGSYHGWSAEAEVLWVTNTYRGIDGAMKPLNYDQEGWNLQVTYMLPYWLPPTRHSRLELGFRVEEYGRDSTAPITMPGDPNQSEREWTACISYYLRKHTLKLQLAGNHYEQLETQTVTGANATYNHDQLLLQATYRVE
jgi:hypothetical protein